LIGLNQFEEAVETCNTSIGVDSNRAPPYNHKGNKTHENVLAGRGSIAQYHVLIATALRRMHKYQEAMECSNFAISIDSNYGEALAGKGKGEVQ